MVVLKVVLKLALFRKHGCLFRNRNGIYTDLQCLLSKIDGMLNESMRKVSQS